MNSIFTLKGTIKHYDWGGFSFIPRLLNTDNEDGKPFAEYWLGVHPQDHCVIETGGHAVLLKEYLSDNTALLGEKVKKQFGHLPYLLKVLDVHRMLSIQVHPSKKAAEKEFARENEEGIALDSIHRNYKDDNHKPELMVAMGEFWLLHGFKPAEKLKHILETIPEFSELLDEFNKNGYQGLYHRVMTMPQEDVNSILKPLLNRIVPLYNNGQLKKQDENFWAARATLSFPHNGKADRGIFSIYFFNLLQLKKGEGIFQDAGVPHAYLEGQNVEIMASSDNVLRGGLTNKHIDVTELLKHVRCEPIEPSIVKNSDGEPFEKTYDTPAADFRLSVFDLKSNETTFNPVTAEIILVTEGTVELQAGAQKLKLQQGHPAAVVFPGNPVKLVSVSGATVFRATVV